MLERNRNKITICNFKKTKDDHCDGIGTVILRNGDCYEGEFSFGQPSGFGILGKQKKKKQKQNCK